VKDHSLGQCAMINDETIDVATHQARLAMGISAKHARTAALGRALVNRSAKWEKIHVRFSDLTRTSPPRLSRAKGVVEPGWLHHLAVPLLAAKRSLKIFHATLGWMVTVSPSRAPLRRTEQN
jgi:hypothetical protein